MTIRPEYFGATSKKFFQLLTSSLTTFDRTAMPVVPQSLGIWYSSFGSHHRPLNCLLMYLAFGTLDQSIFWMKPPSTMRRGELGRRRPDVPLAAGAGLELGQQLLVRRVGVVGPSSIA